MCGGDTFALRYNNYARGEKHTCPDAEDGSNSFDGTCGTRHVSSALPRGDDDDVKNGTCTVYAHNRSLTRCGVAYPYLRGHLQRGRGRGSCVLRGNGWENGNAYNCSASCKRAYFKFGKDFRTLRRGAAILIISFVLILALSLSVGAISEKEEEDVIKMPDAYGDMLDSINEGSDLELPKELFSDDLEDVAKGANEISSPAYLLSRAVKIFKTNTKSLILTFALLCTFVLASAVLRGLGGTLNSSLSSTFSFTLNIVMCITVISALYGSISCVKAYLKTLGALMDAMLPLMSMLYLMGGNVTQSTVNNAAMTAFLTLSEKVIGSTIIPFSSSCMAISAASSFEGGINLSSVAGVIKRTYTTLISLIAFFLSAALAAQSTLASRADTLAMKGVKFLSSNMIPVAGAAVGEGIRTAAASVSYMRSAVGTVGIVTLLLAFFSVFSYLIILRFFLNLSSGIADMLTCGAEKRMLSEMASMVGYVITAISLCTLTFIFALTIFVKCACAV